MKNIINLNILILLLTIFDECFLMNQTFILNNKKEKNKEKLPKYGQNSFQPIRINYILLDHKIIPGLMPFISDLKFQRFKKLIIDPVNTLFQKSLKVYPLKRTPNDVSAIYQFDLNNEIELDYEKYFEDGKYDYVFFILFSPLEKEELASTQTIFTADIEGFYKRPAAGIIFVNIHHFENFLQQNDFELQETRRVFYHEITHALGYSEEFYKYYIDEEGETLNKCLIQPYKYPDRIEYFLQHPKIKSSIAEYYNCSDNNGYPLSKKDKSHFHQGLSIEEIMRPYSDDSETKLTKFVLDLFDITGWYIVDKSLAEKTLYGKNKGCNFINLYCEDETGKLFEEYCDPIKQKDEEGCDFYYESPAYCHDETKIFEINCQYWMPYNNKRCNTLDQKTDFGQYSSISKCFRMEIEQKKFSECFPSFCNKEEKSITLIIKGEQHISYYKTGKPSLEKIQMIDDTFKKVFVFFPDSYERFCFLQFNRKKYDKEL